MGEALEVTLVQLIKSGVWLYDRWWSPASHTIVKNMVSSCETINCSLNYSCLRCIHPSFLLSVSFPLLLTFHSYKCLPHSTTTTVYIPFNLLYLLCSIYDVTAIYICQCLKCHQGSRYRSPFVPYAKKNNCGT